MYALLVFRFFLSSLTFRSYQSNDIMTSYKTWKHVFHYMYKFFITIIYSYQTNCYNILNYLKQFMIKSSIFISIYVTLSLLITQLFLSLSKKPGRFLCYYIISVINFLLKTEGRLLISFKTIYILILVKPSSGCLMKVFP